MYSVNQIIWFSTEYQIMIFGYNPNINNLPNIIWLNRIFNYSVATLLNSKSETTYDRMFSKLLEIEPALNPTSIMVDFEKASINSLESHFTASTSGCFFHLSQNIYRKIQTEGLAQEYIQDMEYGIKLKMLASLAFVPETDVIDSFNILMAEFPQSASNIAKYFENYYIGKNIPDNTRRIPTFPIRLWNMHTRILNNMPHTNNCVEGWHNAFKSGICHAHPSFPKLLIHLQREQSLQEAIYAKWEGGSIKQRSKQSIEQEKRLQSIVEDYQNRDILVYLRGIAYNFNL